MSRTSSYNFLGDNLHNDTDGYGGFSNDSQQDPRRTSAIHLAEKLVSDADIKEAPVNVRQVITHLQKEFRLNVEKMSLTKNLSAVLVRVGELEDELADPSYLIAFNKDDPWCRRRFGIAHEIGHLLFNTTCTKAKGGRSPIETECNIFASELLMPRNFLKKDFAKTPQVPDLAKQYLVSQESLCYKLGDDGLLKF